MTDQQYFERLLAHRDPPSLGRFEPFRLDFRLGGPICLTHPWMHLDGLLAHLALFDALGRDYFLLPCKAPIRMPRKWRRWRTIPLKRSVTDICHASVSFLEPADLQVRVTNLYKRFETVGAERLRKKKIYRGQGYFRDFILRQPYWPARKVSFYGCGDVRRIRDLLDRHLMGLGNDVRVGFGPIRDWLLTPIPDDLSLVNNGRAARPLPLAMCRTYDQADVVRVACRSPYWLAKNVEPCVIPGGRCELQ